MTTPPSLATTPTAALPTNNNADEFDPLLSPHAYANGADAGPVVGNAGVGGASSSIAATQKLGIILIDHGSKRQASNDHIHNIAGMYEDRLNRRNANAIAGSNRCGGETSSSMKQTVVRAAHMEIATPSILTSLRDIIQTDNVQKIVCVPYFLSPGRHATEDIPQLIDDARGELKEEGWDVDILVSGALGTRLDCMLGAVDDLVGLALNE